MTHDTGAAPPPSRLGETLNAILSAQLIRPADESEPAFLFKHTLMQETAYGSLMRHDRRRLHRLVAETLERAAPERPDELAPVLGAHFREAGENARALPYLRRAGEAAAARYANREALAFFSDALDSAAHPPAASDLVALHRARGQIYERIGEFELARADLETALELAPTGGDVRGEWQALMDLGFLWFARDYSRAGAYLERALALARERGDPLLVAYSLNRVGNWYLNNEEPERALSDHREALALFEQLHEARGIADTTDLLAMTFVLGGDLTQAADYYTRSIELATALGDKPGIITALATLTLCSPSPQTHTLAPAEPDLTAAIARARRALPLTREIGWRAGETYVLWNLAFALGAQGDYAAAFSTARQALAIAREIDHPQWQVSAQTCLGELFSELRAYPQARTELENAFARAQETHSLHWIRASGGFLASTCIAQGDLDRAAAILALALPPGTPARMVGQRLCYAARVELALALGEPNNAAADLDTLFTQTLNLRPGVIIPRLWLLRARTSLQQGHPDRALADLLPALAQTQAHSIPYLQRQIHDELAATYRVLGDPTTAAEHASAAEQTLKSLTANLVSSQTAPPLF